MPTVGQQLLTAEEFQLLPDPEDGTKQELVKGVIVSMPQPGLEHGEVQTAIASVLRAFVKPNRLGRVVVETGVVTERGPDSVRGPDVSYWSIERLPLESRVVGYHVNPPDLCAEVRSPSDRKSAMLDKVKEYLFAGVRVVWVADPEDRTVTIFTGPLEGRVLLETAEIDGGEVLPGFRCKVAEFFD